MTEHSRRLRQHTVHPARASRRTEGSLNILLMASVRAEPVEAHKSSFSGNLPAVVSCPHYSYTMIQKISKKVAQGAFRGFVHREESCTLQVEYGLAALDEVHRADFEGSPHLAADGQLTQCGLHDEGVRNLPQVRRTRR